MSADKDARGNGVLVPSDKLKAMQARIAELEAECLEQARLNGMGSEREAVMLSRIAELERKLAEQQASYTKIHNAFCSVWVVIPHQTFFAKEQIDKGDFLLTYKLNCEELNNLLTKAKEEGREDGISRYKALLSAAPKPQGETE